MTPFDHTARQHAYQEYPRTLHGAGGVVKRVHTDDEKAAALEAGWSLLPVADAAAVVEDAAPKGDAASAPEPEAPTAAPKKKPGRKPKGDAASA